MLVTERAARWLEQQPDALKGAVQAWLFERVEDGPPPLPDLSEIEPEYEYEYTLSEEQVVVDFSVLVSPFDRRILVVGLRYA